MDINPANNPDIVDDGQSLSKIESNSFNRWRCDPPYNCATAHRMYNTEIPLTSKLWKLELEYVKLIHYYSYC